MVLVYVLGQRREVRRPLFPSYLFAAFDSRKEFRTVHYARGVRRVVTFGGEAAEVPPELLRDIRARMRDGYVVLQPAPLNGLIQLIQKLRTSHLQRLFGLWANQDVEELWIHHPGPGGSRKIVRMYPHTPDLPLGAGCSNPLR